MLFRSMIFAMNPGGASGPPAIRSGSRLRLREGSPTLPPSPPHVQGLQPIWKRWLAHAGEAPGGNPTWNWSCPGGTAWKMLDPAMAGDGLATAPSPA